MNKEVLFLTLSYALFYNFVDAQDECEEQINKFMKTWNEIIEEKNAPDCFYKYGLERFKSTGDEEKRRKYSEFKEYMKNLSTEDQKSVKDCFEQLGKMVMRQIGREMSYKCYKKLRSLEKK
ncbi:hypothetical protein NPIL_581311 [Nephila pilipes]|uniref:Uncharacterized protein n=1 Tax=Nephila pilipes TaxID=299642 RepID=A0A8X6QBK0_NEPPI|nr:hypothetical protein NPIL_581311 [Nephila pilipes]